MKTLILIFGFISLCLSNLFKANHNVIIGNFNRIRGNYNEMSGSHSNI